MKLYIKGGVGEYGRNCFYAECGELSFMVDCGAGSEANTYPDLSDSEILNCKTLFLTHSHKDHTGALDFIIERGFKGDIVASDETFKQMKNSYDNSISINREKKVSEINGLKLSWGRTGHCAGSLWYFIEVKGKRLLFTGDYNEDTEVYKRDKIRGLSGDIAIVDCAYGRDLRTYDDYMRDIFNFALKNAGGSLIFPVPKYGRGIEIYHEFKKRFNNFEIFGDKHFLRELKKSQKENFWIRNINTDNFIKEDFKGGEVIFISDPQLKKEKSLKKIKDFLEERKILIITGHTDKSYLSHRLLNDGLAKFFLFPVHMNYRGFEKIKKHNNFKIIIPYHSEEFNSENFYEI